MVGRIHLEAGEQLAVHAGDAAGGVQESVAVRVFAEGCQQLANGRLDSMRTRLCRDSQRGMRSSFGRVQV